MFKNQYNDVKPVKLKTYSSVHLIRNKIFVRGIDEQGNRVSYYDEFQPTVWVPYEFDYREYKGDIINVDFKRWTCLVDDVPLVGLTFKNIYTCKEFVRKNSKITKNPNGQGVSIDTRVHTSPNSMFVSQYIAEKFAGDCQTDSSSLKIYTYDIETEVGHREVDDDTVVYFVHKTDQTKSNVESQSICQFEKRWNKEDYLLQDPYNSSSWIPLKQHPYRYVGGFPDPMEAKEKVTLITVKDLNASQIWTWGLEDFVNERDDVTYIQCKDEKTLLKSFVEFIEQDYPDATTNWNGSAFDNTYICNRVKNILGEDWMKRLSPCGEINFKQVEFNEYGRSIVETSWVGINDLDYLRLYKKFTYGQKPSYKLDAIAEFEIGIKKIPNPTGGSFKDFYTGEFDVTTKPNEDDHQIKKLGYIRTQLKKTLYQHPENMDKYNQLNEKIIRMCKQLFIEYNIRDVELVDKIDAKQKFIDLIMTIGYMAHCNFENVFSPVQMWDYFLYNTLLEQNKVIPIKHSGQKSEKFPGAYVKPPLVGRHEFCESSTSGDITQ